MDSITSLANHSDYRVYLRDFYQLKKQASPRWNYAVWARQLKIKSPSTLIMILNGQRHPGPALVQSLIRYLKLTGDDADQFQDLVRLQKVKSDPSLTILLLEKLRKRRPDGEFRLLEQSEFYAISNWYYYAIREMVRLPQFREDGEWISEALLFKVTPRQAKAAIDTMLRLNLLGRDKGGKLFATSRHLDTSRDIADEGLKRFHEQTLANARECIRRVEVDRREISGGCFAIRVKDIPEAKKRIAKFQRELCDLLEMPEPDAVYQLEISLFPLSK